jgi:DNA-binding LacI/PurR family transcriptional regulator
MTATMRDVARRANVSLATVSYVMNQGPRPVSAQLRERVLAAMRELDYQPGRRGRSRVRPLAIGVVVPDASNPFFALALDGLAAVLGSEGHLTLSGSSYERPDRERSLISSLRQARVDGLVLTPCGPVPAEAEQMDRAGQPVVLMDRDGGSDRLPRVMMDNYRSAFQATRLLIESGHRRIGFVNGPDDVSTARERLRGYRDALAFAGLRPVDEHVRGGPFTVEQGRLATLDLLGLRSRPDAIFSSSAILTAGVVRALRQHGVRWPDDIGLVCFGDDTWASLVTPPLTVIEQPAQQLGEVAARLLLGAEGSRADARQVVLDSRVVLRESHWRAARLEESAQ